MGFRLDRVRLILWKDTNIRFAYPSIYVRFGSHPSRTHFFFNIRSPQENASNVQANISATEFHDLGITPRAMLHLFEELQILQVPMRPSIHDFLDC